MDALHFQWNADAYYKLLIVHQEIKNFTNENVHMLNSRAYKYKEIDG